MASDQEAIDKISALVEGKISLQEFEDWSALYAWNVHKSADQHTQSIAYKIRGLLNEHADDLDDEALLVDLRGVARPFVSSPDTTAGAHRAILRYHFEVAHAAAPAPLCMHAGISSKAVLVSAGPLSEKISASSFVPLCVDAVA